MSAINLPDSVTLGGDYYGGRASPVGVTGSRHLLQWAAGLQQQRRRRVFMIKADVAASCARIASAGPRYVCLNRKL